MGADSDDSGNARRHVSEGARTAWPEEVCSNLTNPSIMYQLGKKYGNYSACS